jgi:GT2 family glycosyltransferase
MSHIPTCNISYKRQVFERLKGFNPDYYPQEDLEFNYRLINSGGTIYFSPDIIVHHHHRSRLQDFLKHQKKVGEITSRMLKILPLAGAGIARSPFLSILAIPVLPVIKWLKTVGLFYKMKRSIIVQHPLALLVFALGLVPWSIGFLQGAFKSANGKPEVKDV